MSKKLKIIIGSIIVLVILTIAIIIGLNYKSEPTYTITNDSLKFKEEYEKINGLTNERNGKTYISINIKSYNPFVYSSYDEIFKLLDNGTGVIYFGFPECPWCRNLVPVLSDSAIANNVKEVYYLNIREDRDTKELTSKGKIKTTKEGTDNYNKLLDILNKYLPAYEGLKDDTIKRVYLPTVIFVKDGKVIGLEQSLESFSKRADGNAYQEMNVEEKAELTKVFEKYYEKLAK